MPDAARSTTIREFIDDRIDAVLAFPELFGSAESVVAQVLLLLRLRAWPSEVGDCRGPWVQRVRSACPDKPVTAPLGDWLSTQAGAQFLRTRGDDPLTPLTFVAELLRAHVVDARRDALHAAEAGPAPAAPVPMLLWCPACGDRHVDAGEFAERAHHTHSCQSCGLTWRPAVVPTVGVLHLPGFKDPSPDPTGPARPPLHRAARPVRIPTAHPLTVAHRVTGEVLAQYATDSIPAVGDLWTEEEHRDRFGVEHPRREWRVVSRRWRPYYPDLSLATSVVVLVLPHATPPLRPGARVRALADAGGEDWAHDARRRREGQWGRTGTVVERVAPASGDDDRGDRDVWEVQLAPGDFALFEARELEVLG